MGGSYGTPFLDNGFQSVSGLPESGSRVSVRGIYVPVLFHRLCQSDPADQGKGFVERKPSSGSACIWFGNRKSPVFHSEDSYRGSCISVPALAGYFDPDAADAIPDPGGGRSRSVAAALQRAGEGQTEERDRRNRVRQFGIRDPS